MNILGFIKNKKIDMITVVRGLCKKLHVLYRNVIDRIWILQIHFKGEIEELQPCTCITNYTVL